MHYFDGRYYSNLLEQKIKDFLVDQGDKPSNQLSVGKLGIVQIGDNESSKKYVALKIKVCESLGIKTEQLKLAESLDDQEIISKVKNFFDDNSIGGGIIQLPLPRKTQNTILDLIPEEKDIDLLSFVSKEKFYAGDFSRLSPVVRSTKYFLDTNNINVKGKKVLIIGYGDLVGKPIAWYLHNLGANVVVAEKDFLKLKNLPSGINIVDAYSNGIKIDAELVVSSTGVPGLIDPRDLDEGCFFIDFGSSVVDGKTVGDMDYSIDHSHLAYIAKSPGSLGPLVVRFLIMNFLGI